MSSVFGIHQGQPRCQHRKPAFVWDFEKAARAEGVRMGIIPRRRWAFPPAKFSPGPASISPGADKDTYRTIDRSLMTMADVGLIPLDRSYRDPWRVLCLAIVMEAQNCSINARNLARRMKRSRTRMVEKQSRTARTPRLRTTGSRASTSVRFRQVPRLLSTHDTHATASSCLTRAAGMRWLREGRTSREQRPLGSRVQPLGEASSRSVGLVWACLWNCRLAANESSLHAFARSA